MSFPNRLKPLHRSARESRFSSDAITVAATVSLFTVGFPRGSYGPFPDRAGLYVRYTRACYLHAVKAITRNFRGLRRHPRSCKLWKLHLAWVYVSGTICPLCLGPLEFWKLKMWCPLLQEFTRIRG